MNRKNQRKNVETRAKRSIKVNKKYKDTLFKKLFGKESAAVEVYNAIEGTNYGPESVSMVTKGCNPKIAQRSATLNGYEVYIAKIRKYGKTMRFEQAFARATDECIKEDILADFLKLNRKAVQNMLTAVWDHDVEKRVIREETQLETRLETSIKIARRLKAKGMSVNEIIELTDLSVDEVLKA